MGRLNALGQERRALEERRDHLVAQHAGWQERQAHLREVRAMIAAIRETLRDPHGLSYDERRDVLAMLDAQVLLFPTDAAERWELYLSLDPEAPPALVATASSWTVYTTTRCSPSARASTW